MEVKHSYHTILEITDESHGRNRNNMLNICRNPNKEVTEERKWYEGEIGIINNVFHKYNTL